MKTIKKTTLIAAITAMTAFAVPSMASAATWTPLNANKTLTSVGAVVYTLTGSSGNLGFTCSSSTLGVHVRTPASSTIDITSASFTGCPTNGSPQLSCTATVTATGLPWAATTSGSNVTYTEHLQVTYSCLPGYTFTVDGQATGSYSNATHTLSTHPTTMNLYSMGSQLGAFSPDPVTTWHETTNTLNLA